MESVFCELNPDFRKLLGFYLSLVGFRECFYNHMFLPMQPGTRNAPGSVAPSAACHPWVVTSLATAALSPFRFPYGAGSAEDDWHDARSAASTSSVVSLLNAGGSSGGDFPEGHPPLHSSHQHQQHLAELQELQAKDIGMPEVALYNPTSAAPFKAVSTAPRLIDQGMTLKQVRVKQCWYRL